MRTVRFPAVRAYALAIVFGGWVVAPVQAGMFRNVVQALRFSGFMLDADHNRVSNTSVAAAGTTFQGNTIDLGDFNLSLTGPVAAVVERGGRGLPTFDVTFSTGALNVNPNGVATVGAAQPLGYMLNFDSGTNTTNVSGNLLADGRFSINKLGSYDLRLQFSDRQTATVDGRFDTTSPLNFNVDLGPVDIQGNIFADVLAVVTDPFFKASGTENFFAPLSGLAALGALGDSSSGSGISNSAPGGTASLAARTVPEPTAFFLLVMVAPFLPRRP